MRMRINLRASTTLWLLGALSGPKTPGCNGSMPQADSLAHQERVKKVNDFRKMGTISIWNNSFRAQIWLRMHLRASRTLWLLGALSGPQTPATMAVHNGQAALHNKRRGKNGKLFSQNRTNIIIWNQSFGPQIRLIMHLRVSTTLSLLAETPHPRPQWQCATGGWPLCDNGIRTWTP